MDDFRARLGKCGADEAADQYLNYAFSICGNSEFKAGRAFGCYRRSVCDV
jgi:hypothetical protein